MRTGMEQNKLRWSWNLLLSCVQALQNYCIKWFISSLSWPHAHHHTIHWSAWAQKSQRGSNVLWNTTCCGGPYLCVDVVDGIIATSVDIMLLLCYSVHMYCIWWGQKGVDIELKLRTNKFNLIIVWRISYCSQVSPLLAVYTPTTTTEIKGLQLVDVWWHETQWCSRWTHP